MTIVAMSYAVPSTNPPGLIQLTPPGGISSVKAVRLSNYTPFPFTLKGVGDDTASQPTLAPFTQNAYAYSNLRGPILATGAAIATGTPLVPGLEILAEFTDEPTDLQGSYPAILPGLTIVQLGPNAQVTVVGGTVGVTNSGGPLSISGTVTDLLPGSYHYDAKASGTIHVPNGGRIIEIHAYASMAAANFTIAGGATIGVPATGEIVRIQPKGNLVAPLAGIDIVATNTDDIFADWMV